MTAEQRLYRPDACGLLGAAAWGVRVTNLTVASRSSRSGWQLRPNAVWRFGRLFLICPHCHRRVTQRPVRSSRRTDHRRAQGRCVGACHEPHAAPDGSLKATSIHTWVLGPQDVRLSNGQTTLTPVAGAPIGTVTESLTLTVIGGSGQYAGATGTMTLHERRCATARRTCLLPRATRRSSMDADVFADAIQIAVSRLSADAPTLIAEIRQREDRTADIDRALARPAINVASLRRDLEERLLEWKRLLRERPAQGQSRARLGPMG